ncbi:PREDICTED: uncharacterized protein LOC106149061 [Chinchilla lanigera]|uniref:uncharacterized protein LOC106149061 n=1 Tax=Chinchilla lanigera TaxID=34839 RepID=UPI00069701CC|nr:PREDICTED: uncharacterized protein LOC106149061 [Chinchilla lanigera]
MQLKEIMSVGKPPVKEPARNAPSGQRCWAEDQFDEREDPTVYVKVASKALQCWGQAAHPETESTVPPAAERLDQASWPPQCLHRALSLPHKLKSRAPADPCSLNEGQ